MPFVFFDAASAAAANIANKPLFMNTP